MATFRQSGLLAGRRSNKRVVVVGGSDTGLAAARRLSSAGDEVLVLDKRFVPRPDAGFMFRNDSASVVAAFGVSILIGTRRHDLPSSFHPTISDEGDGSQSRAWPTAMRFLAPRSAGAIADVLSPSGVRDRTWRTNRPVQPESSSDRSAEASREASVRKLGEIYEPARRGPVAAFGRVTHIRSLANGWAVEGFDAAEGNTHWEADEVVLAAGVFGTTEILLRSREIGLSLSDSLGTRVCANADFFAWDALDIAEFVCATSAVADGSRRAEKRLSPFRDLIPAAMNEDPGLSTMYWSDGVRVQWYEGSVGGQLNSALRQLPLTSADWRNNPVSISPAGGCCAAERAEDGVVNGTGQVFNSQSGDTTHAGLSIVDASVFSAPERGRVNDMKRVVVEHVTASMMS